MYFRLSSMFCVALAAACAQQSGSLIVTAESAQRGDQPAPAVTRDDISATVEGKPTQIVSWTPLAGAEAALQLYIVIDDSESTSLGIQFGDVKNFLNSQPPATAIGLAYLRNGVAFIVQAPTADRAQVARKLRLPLGEPGIDASPYIGVRDLIEKWPVAEARREVLLISSGIDPMYLSADMLDPYLTEAIDAAQKAGIVVSSIYHSDGGHLGHSFFRLTWGQNYLSMLDEDTGGEFYWQGIGNPVSFAPFLKQFAERLNHQYLLTVAAEPLGKPELKPVRVRATKGGASLTSATKVYLNRPLSSQP